MIFLEKYQFVFHKGIKPLQYINITIHIYSSFMVYSPRRITSAANAHLRTDMASLTYKIFVSGAISFVQILISKNQAIPPP